MITIISDLTPTTDTFILLSESTLIIIIIIILHYKQKKKDVTFKKEKYCSSPKKRDKKNGRQIKVGKVGKEIDDPQFDGQRIILY